MLECRTDTILFAPRGGLTHLALAAPHGPHPFCAGLAKGPALSKAFNAAVRDLFAAEMVGGAPTYQRQAPGPKPHALPGEIAWAATGQRTWIILVPSLKGYNEFTVEVGWSLLGRYPELGARPIPVRPDANRSEWSRPEGLLRIVSLDQRYPEWWQLEAEGAADDLLAQAEAATRTLTAAEAARAAAHLVPNAIAAVREVAIPYLTAWTARPR